MTDHARALTIPSSAWDDPSAAEILRAWIVDGGLHVNLWRAFPESRTWGLLLVDIARHVARMYAQDTGISEQQALDDIRNMFDAEWDRPTDLGTTTAANN